MTLITLFSAPKPFAEPRTAVAQRNAIGSWRRLADTEIVLLGDEPGLAEAAREIGCVHIPQVAVNENRVPLISSMFKLARSSSDSALLGIVNSDMLLMSDFLQALRTVTSLVASGGLKHGFVLLGRRWDLDVPGPIEFVDRWEDRLHSEALARGRLHRPTGSDVFVFPRDQYTEVPDFAIGRAGWDNWMIYKARLERWPVIDLTPSVTMVHQNHDYRHLPGARPHYDHPETKRNTMLAGGPAITRYTILDATHVLREGRLAHPEISGQLVARRVELVLRRIFFFLPRDLVESLARPRRWKKHLQNWLGRAGQ